MDSKQLKFSIFYFLSISIYAFILAFFPIHCKVIGLSAFEIALVTASGTLATVIGPPIALHVAHHYLSSRKVLIYSSLISALSYLPLLFSSNLYSICFSWLLINCFKRAADAIVDTTALNLSENFSFERVRLWGSIGFMITMGTMGPMVDRYGPQTIAPFGMLLSIVVLLSSFNIKSEIENSVGKSKSYNVVNNIFPRELISFFSILIISFSLITASHSALYIYLSIYLRSLHWTASEISWTWNVGVLSEVIMFLCFTRFEKYFGLLPTLWISTVVTVIRWFIMANTQDKILIFLSQILHSFSFAACYTAAVKLVSKILPDNWKSRGQGLVISVGFGLGAVIGRIAMGFFANGLDSDSELNVLFLISAYIALISLTLNTLLYLKNARTGILEKKFD